MRGYARACRDRVGYALAAFEPAGGYGFSVTLRPYPTRGLNPGSVRQVQGEIYNFTRELVDGFDISPDTGTVRTIHLAYPAPSPNPNDSWPDRELLPKKPSITHKHYLCRLAWWTSIKTPRSSLR